MWQTLWPPVSLATAAALLKRDGHRVRVIDFGAKGGGGPALEGALLRETPDFVFWSTGTPTLSSDLQWAAMIQRMLPASLTGVIGTHVSSLPAEALGVGEGASCDEVGPDVVVRGEPEDTLRRLCSCGRAGLHSVRGISFRDPASGAICHNADAGFIRPADIPPADWSDLDLGAYRLPLSGRPFLIVTPVRGCPYGCSFCTAPAYYGRRVRKRPVGRVVEEIEENLARHGVREFFFWADTFTVDKGYVLGLCDEIAKQRLGISWSCNSRVDTVDRELLSAMKRAGLWMVSFGMESASQLVLDRCGKGITREQSVAAVRLAHGMGIRTVGHFIFGLPGESRTSMEETLRFSLELPLDFAQYYAAAPFPGTRLYEEAGREGWLREASGFSQERAGMDLPGLPGREVEAFRRRAYRAFYGRPRIVAGLLAMMKPAGMRLLLRGSVGLRG